MATIIGVMGGGWLLLLLVLAGDGVPRGIEVPEIPFRLLDDRVVLPVSVEGSETLGVTLDTGMPIEGIYVFRSGFAAYMHRTPQWAQVGGAGDGEASRVQVFDSTTVYVGEVPLTDQLVLVSFSPVTQDFPRGGVIGKSLLGHYAVEIDYDAMMVRLHPPGWSAPDSSWEVIELELGKNDIPFLEVFISVAEEETVPARVYIDLASEEALEILTRPDMKFPVPEDSEERYIGSGLSGDIHGRLGSVSRLQLGEFVLRDLPAEFTPAEVRSRQEGADGILGNGVFRRFHAVFDLPRSRLYLKPNRNHQP